MNHELTENTVGIWYVDMDGQNSLATLTKKDDDSFECVIRLRIYVDDKNFDSKDKKVWYTEDMGTDKAEAIKFVEQMMTGMCEIFNGELTVLMKGESTLDQFMKEFEKLPFVHMQVKTKEEYEELLSK